jgi:hypothetical protein
VGEHSATLCVAELQRAKFWTEGRVGQIKKSNKEIFFNLHAFYGFFPF